MKLKAEDMPKSAVQADRVQLKLGSAPAALRCVLSAAKWNLTSYHVRVHMTWAGRMMACTTLNVSRCLHVTALCLPAQHRYHYRHGCPYCTAKQMPMNSSTISRGDRKLS